MSVTLDPLRRLDSLGITKSNPVKASQFSGPFGGTEVIGGQAEWVKFDLSRIPVPRRHLGPPSLPNRDLEIWKVGLFKPPRLISPPLSSTIDPRLMMKAYAKALRGLITPAPDLSKVSQAIFIANPLQYGLPSGYEKQEYLNEALFNLADPMQNDESPAFDRSGISYFEWLDSYVRSVKDPLIVRGEMTVTEYTAKEHLRADAKKAYNEASAAVEAEYAKMFQHFAMLHSLDPTMTLQRWISGDTGMLYRRAIDKRETAFNFLTGLETTGVMDIVRRRQIVESALEQTELRQGNNMPCTLRDLDPNTIDLSALPLSGIVYRPLYYLSGYRDASTSWVRDYRPEKRQRLPLDLRKARETTWKELGFPKLDAEPGALNPSATLPDWTIWLEYTSIGFWDVSRGLWEISGLRTLLPALAVSAPEGLKTPVWKTIRVLVGYDVDIVVTLSSNTLAKLSPDGAKAQIPPQIVDALNSFVGFLPATLRADGEIHAKGAMDNAYPSLLAVLSQRV